MLSVPAADAAGGLGFMHVLAVGTGVSTLWVFSDAATFGVLPQLVGRRHVAEATSALVTMSTFIALVGPVAAGVLVTITSPALAIGVDGAAHLVVAAGTATLRWRGSEDGRTSGVDGSMRGDIAEGLRYIWDHPVIRWFTVLGAGASLAGGAVTGLLVVIGVEQLGLEADDAALGRLFAAGAVGTLVASVFLPRLQRAVGVGVITTSGYGVALVTLLALSWTSDLGVGLVVLALFNCALTLLIVNGIVTRQVVTPDRLQSRVNTTARLIAWGGNPVGAALAGFTAELTSTGWALRLASLGLVASLVAAVAVGMPRYPRLDDLAPSEP